jgi:hypothetical protein
MQQTEEKVKETDPFDEWENELAESSEFFKPKEGEKYDIVIHDFEFAKKPFKDGEEPKWRMSVRLFSVNAKLSSQEWTTASATIIRALRPYKGKWDELSKIIWRLRKIKKNDRTEYIFEDIGRVGGTPPVPLTKEQKAEAFC